MKAIHFYDTLINNKYKSFCSADNITIHEIGSDDLISNHLSYTIYKDGLVIDNNGKVYEINKLTGDYEVYNQVQFLKCGYILLDKPKKYSEIIKIISMLCETFEEERYDKKISIEQKHRICGCSSWNSKSLNESFSYYSPYSDIEVSISTIPFFSLYNNKYRKEMKKKCLPFDKNIKKESGFYITFTSLIIREDLINKVKMALNDLLSYFNEPTWFDLDIQNNIYH